jgi:hypothetical protein
MTTKAPFRSRKLLFPFGVALGLVCAVAYARRGEYGQAVFAVVLMTTFGAALAFSPSEWAVAQGRDADERQRAINDQAVRHAYGAVIVVAVGGFLVELYRGTAGPFTLISAVGGFVHMASLAILQRRR